MDIAKMLNVTILACLLILTGCFGLGATDDDVIDDADAEDSGSGSTTVVNNYYNNTTTTMGIPPEVHVVEDEWAEPVPLFDSDEEMIGYSAYNVTLHYGMLDVDGTITDAGIDFDLDGIVDVPVSDSRGHINLSIPISEWETCWLGDDMCEEAMITTVAFIATDDDFMSTVEMISFIGSMYDDGGTPSGAYVLEATDHSDDVEDDAGLMTLYFGNGDDLDWALVQIEIIKDSVPTTCNNPGNTGGNCGATQHGGQDSEHWEKGEILILSDTGANFCDADCDLVVRIKYDGDIIMSTTLHLL